MTAVRRKGSVTPTAPPTVAPIAAIAAHPSSLPAPRCRDPAPTRNPVTDAERHGREGEAPPGEEAEAAEAQTGPKPEATRTYEAATEASPTKAPTNKCTAKTATAKPASAKSASAAEAPTTETTSVSRIRAHHCAYESDGGQRDDHFA